MRILCVEDESDLREDIAEYLRMHHYVVDEAECGVDAAEKLKLHNYDLVLCDIKMPRMDGMELLDEVRRDNKLINTPFLFLSAYGENSNKIHASQHGCDGFLSKPIDFSVLSETLKSQVQRQRARSFTQFCTLESLRSHVMQAMGDVLHGSISDTLATIVHMRDTLPTLTTSGVEQHLSKIEKKVQQYTLDMQLLLGALELQTSASGLSYESSTANDIQALIGLTSGAKQQTNSRNAANAASVMVDRSLLRTAISNLIEATPKSRRNSDMLHISITSQGGVITICDHPKMAEEGDYITIDAATNLVELSNVTQARVVALMFAMQVAYAHGGRIEIKQWPEEYLSVRLIFPSTVKDAKAA